MNESRSYQMRIDQADAEVVKPASLNGQPHFVHLRHRRLRQQIQQLKRLGAPSQRSQGKLGDHERMDQNLPLIEELLQFFVARPKMVDPH